ncbi:SpvB/TcaC N-terminal domain-containing protein [Streptomyces sp. NPDC088253]|uniref:SpvB/TcaC N-terminal domain-containing protein n=1 Tax=Streptomyces sp. NPDC088253 TaxID=3365846 RepID=UPI00381F3AE8
MERSKTSAQPPETKPPGATPPPVPEVTLPKGGGAIRAIGEKFTANPVTGTGSVSVPVSVSPGRAGFGPALSLTYDSGSGNGPYGLGWSISTPHIHIKTQDALPLYEPATPDSPDADVYALSDAEDLVPELTADGGRQCDTTTDPRYVIHRYRPRVEGLFARIERWTRVRDGVVHWRSLSADNVLTLFGADRSSRIAEPGHPERVFSWLISETRDDRGNAVVYTYKCEDGEGIDATAPHQLGRGPADDCRRSANRYLKRIRYGNRIPLLDGNGSRQPRLVPARIAAAKWLFEVVFDYGEHDDEAPTPEETGDWALRDDPFSSYRAGFEVRTNRLCRRILMFHRFPLDGEPAVPRLVRSTDLTYTTPVSGARACGATAPYACLCAVTHSGYVPRREGGYLKRSMPPVEFGYTAPVVDPVVHDVDRDLLEELPVGVDETRYRWTDLHGEGMPGILSEQDGGAWYYARNLSPASERTVDFAPPETVPAVPNVSLADGSVRFCDLEGNGLPDLVLFDGPYPGSYEHERTGEGWGPFRPFVHHPNRPVLGSDARLVDLDGDGRADLLITESDSLVWYPSLGEGGFGPPYRRTTSLDEEQSPRPLFTDGAESLHLADMSGDGLSDVVRINGSAEICYWPNLGHGRFGAKVVMDAAPVFDDPDRFDPRRLLLVDIDGSGTTDLVYLHGTGPLLYFNQCGNGWSSPPLELASFPVTDSSSSVTVVDVKGNGTAALVWSSPLPAAAARPMRYVDLMSEGKPHLLNRIVNNLGAETAISYAPSGRFFLRDRRAGHPWVSRLPFPVHVVERVETHDAVSGNRFVSQYAYHHGCFDGEEREFRGFGRVDQIDTEHIRALANPDAPATGPPAAGGAREEDGTTDCAPVLTRTWFHTGIYLDQERVSRLFAHEYHQDGYLLDDTVLPDGLAQEEVREAYRALKGSMLRQEVYALGGDGPWTADTEPTGPPHLVEEQNFTVRLLQGRHGNRHAVLMPHPHETLTCHFERSPDDPRVAHSLTLETDRYGNVLKEAAVGYGRDPGRAVEEQQTKTLITYAEHEVTNAVTDLPHVYRTPRPAGTRTYELTGYSATGAADLFCAADFVEDSSADAGVKILLCEGDVDYQDEPAAGRRRRLVEHVRTLYRPDDMGKADGDDPLSLLEHKQLEPLALPGESYELAFPPGLAAFLYTSPDGAVLPPAAVTFQGSSGDQGGYVDLDGDGGRWIPTGRILCSPATADTAARELAYAREHFFPSLRHLDPFGHTTAVTYDAYDLLVQETRDPLGNRITVGERTPAGTVDPDVPGYDYRVLQPRIITDANGNRAEVAFDALGLVVGTAVCGKRGQLVGDTMDGFDPDPDEAFLLDHLAAPFTDPHALLGGATTRLVYDLFAQVRSGGRDPAVVYTLARERHARDSDGAQTPIQHTFTYSDGFGRQIQQKIQAEPGPVPRRCPDGSIVVDADGLPEMTAADADPRWVGSGWTVFNNKGSPVRAYEPFFSDTHRFEADVRVGVSPVVFYDPLQRAVATLHPNHSYEKSVFTPWQQTTYDVNDTVAPHATETGDPRSDADIAIYTARYFASRPATWQTWFASRSAGSSLGQREQEAATQAAEHADTPTVLHLDCLGRSFLTLAHAGFQPDDKPILLRTRLILDIEGNQRAVHDALDRLVVEDAYDLAGRRVRTEGMEAGRRWTLPNVFGHEIRAWDSRGHVFRTEYDTLRRPVRRYVAGTDSADPDRELLAERLVYGEEHPNGTDLNLGGRLWLHLDQAGVAAVESHDFKGNMLRTTRHLALEYKGPLSWQAVDAQSPAAIETALAPLLETDAFTSQVTYDALNRPTTMTAPDGSITTPSYNVAGLLEQVNVLHGTVTERVVENIDYDAKGRHTRMVYGNGVTTDATYDRLTSRLASLLSTRPGTDLQNLHYTYDPVGNITYIRDDAQQAIFFRNQCVEPDSVYTYDPLYRLLQATGREHLAQGVRVRHSHDDALRMRLPHPADGGATGRYCETYEYDAVGNFQAMRHHDACPGAQSWARTYNYREPSLLEADSFNNRLTSTEVAATTEPYTYDAHGNMTSMPHLPLMEYNFHDQLRMTQRQSENTPGSVGNRTYYVYDAAGRRVRKVTETAMGVPVDERVYLSDFELYRRHAGPYTGLVRETLHITTAEQRLALIETRNGMDDGTLKTLTRYQLSNHLGSATVELDAEAEIITYEEYTPYGSTSLQSTRSATETPKRYRYTGKERDEQNGFTYHSSRYYCAWLGRWTACDPVGITDAINLYTYVAGNPCRYHDPQGTDRHDVIAATERGNAYIREVISIADELNAIKEIIESQTQRFNTALGRYVASGNRDAVALKEFESARASLQSEQLALESLERRAQQLHKAPTIGFRGEKELNEARRAGGSPPRTRGEQLAAEIEVELMAGINHAVPAEIIDDAQRAINNIGSADSILDRAVISASEANKSAKLAVQTAHDLQRIAKKPPGGGTPGSGGGSTGASELAKTGEKALGTAAEEGTIKAGAKSLGHTAVKAAPIAGAGIAVYLVSEDIKEERYGRAFVDAVEGVPGVGDIVLAGDLAIQGGTWAIRKWSQFIGSTTVSTNRQLREAGIQ